MTRSEVPNINVLFVCLGNICRSPTAQGVFREQVCRAGLAEAVHVESAGTGDWHVGQAPDERAQVAAAARDVSLVDLRARQVTAADLTRFDYVLAMDADNLAQLERLKQDNDNTTAIVDLFSRYSDRFHRSPVPDPYFGSERGFEYVLDMVEDASRGLLADIEKRLASR